MRYVHFDVYNSKGDFVKREKVYDMADTYAVYLNEITKRIVDGLTQGQYTLKVSAGIAIGHAELQEIDFTINKQSDKNRRDIHPVCFY
jgi:hypothetical protein